MRRPDDFRLEIAAFRRRVIADAIEADGEIVSAALESAAKRSWFDPAGREVRFSVRTLWRWLGAWRRRGLLALVPAERKDKGSFRRLSPELVARVDQLRREAPRRPTRTIIDILVREKRVAPGQLARSTLDRHFAAAGLSRRALATLDHKVFRKIATATPFELVVADFHHGPYVSTGNDEARRSLLCAFIDHWSRDVPEARYYLHEDFVALRFGFRRLVTVHGLPVRLYIDNGPAFHATRFHAGCDALGIEIVHSKPYQSECRGVVERFNRTVLEQFESEVKARESPLTLDELNAFFEAWLAERYRRDIHSETGEAPAERFARAAAIRPAPDLELVDEWLRLRERRTVHRKWSTVEIAGRRYTVNSSLRGRRIDVLHDPLDPSYVLIAQDGRIIERALPQRPGVDPPAVPTPAPQGKPTDYLALLLADHERSTRAELAALRLGPSRPAAELALPDLVVALERCRGATLAALERAEASAFWRKYRPIDVDTATAALENARRRLGAALHLRVYLDALAAALVRTRTTRSQGGKPA